MDPQLSRSRCVAPLLMVLCYALATHGSVSASEAATLKVRITGLFSPEREADLRAILKNWVDIKLVSIDFEHAEAMLSLDAARLFPKEDSARVLQRLDDKLRQASSHTMGVKAPTTVAHDKLERIEIAVEGLDCKACCLAAYEMVARIDGVEQATVSFKEGQITALIDPKKTAKTKLQESLRQRGVTVK